MNALAADVTDSLAGQSDRMLTARVRTDFDQAFVDHYERLVRALTIVAGDREVAADAVQEAFIKAHLRWRTVSRYDDPVGWVRRVAINRLHDGHRREQRKRRALGRLGRATQTVAVDPEIDEFDRLLAALPRQQRATTALYYVAGLTVAEIATALDIADGTVKSHLHDARRKLRPIVAADHPSLDHDPTAPHDQERP